jgi:polysaccharide biosynthesis/export protein
MNLRTIRYLPPALAAVLILSGCSSQDFGNLGAPITDMVDSGKPYVERNDEEVARMRTQRLGELLTAWEERRSEADRNYLVGTDDVLEFGILSLDTPGEVTVLARTVRHDGMVGLPLVGDVKVAGVSPRALEDTVTSAYAGKYIKGPSVTVKVSEYRSAPVVVTGAVAQPGIFYLRHNNSTVLEILGDASGVTPEAGDELIIVRNPDPEGGAGDETPAPKDRPKPRKKPTLTPVVTTASDGGPLMAESGLASIAPLEPEVEPDSDVPTPEMITVNLRDLLVDGDVRMNVIIESGDIITVPPRKAQFVYVLGYVQRPGSFELANANHMRALQAVAMAGGLHSTARAQNSYLISEKNGIRKVVDVDLTKIARGVRPPLYLENGDTLVVGSGMIAKLAEFVRPSLSAGASVSAIP